MGMPTLIIKHFVIPFNANIKGIAMRMGAS
jgi:hypothetical protein